MKCSFTSFRKPKFQYSSMENVLDRNVMSMGYEVTRT